MAFELTIEVVEHNPRLDRAPGALDVEVENSREIFRTIHDQRLADGLSGLRRTAAPRENRRAFAPGNCYRPIGLFNRSRCDHPDRHALVVGGIGGVSAAGEPVELDLARQFGSQPTFQTGHDYGHVFYPFWAELSLCIMTGLPCGKPLDRNVTFIVQRHKRRPESGRARG